MGRDVKLLTRMDSGCLPRAHSVSDYSDPNKECIHTIIYLAD